MSGSADEMGSPPRSRRIYDIPGFARMGGGGGGGGASGSFRGARSRPTFAGHSTGCGCLGCTTERRTGSGDGSGGGAGGLGAGIDAIDRFVRDHYGSMSNKDLADMAEDVYRRAVEQPLRDVGETPRRWAADGIRNHYLKHTLNPYYAIGEEIRCMRNCMAVLRGKLKRIDQATNDHTIDVKNMELYMKCQDRMRQLYKEKPTTMLFADGISEGAATGGGPSNAGGDGGGDA